MVAFIFVLVLYSYDWHAFVAVVGSQAEQIDRGIVLVLGPGASAYSEEDIREDAGEEDSSDAEEYG